MSATRRLAAILLVAGLAAPALAVEEPAGYRMEEYRAPVPETLSGATVLDNAGAHALWETGEAAFLDVLPRPPKPLNLPKDTIWRPKPRHSIPGALWVPNVGFGAIHPDTHAYFKAGLAEATGGDKARPVVIFCLAACWMSWNAAKRALEYGYERVYWYPDGSDGWQVQGHATEELMPFEAGAD